MYLFSYSRVTIDISNRLSLKYGIMLFSFR